MLPGDGLLVALFLGLVSMVPFRWELQFVACFVCIDILLSLRLLEHPIDLLDHHEVLKNIKVLLVLQVGHLVQTLLEQLLYCALVLHRLC